MITRLAVFICLALCTMSCSQKKGNKLSEIREIRQGANEANGKDNAFVQAAKLEISEPSAVYFHPDSIKLQKLEETLGDKFFTDAEESMGNLSSSRDYMIRNQIKIIETEARELTFKKADGSISTIDLSDPKYSWGLFLFNGTDNPVQVDMASPEKATSSYMKK